MEAGWGYVMFLSLLVFIVSMSVLEAYNKAGYSNKNSVRKGIYWIAGMFTGVAFFFFVLAAYQFYKAGQAAGVQQGALTVAAQKAQQNAAALAASAAGR